MRSQPEKDFITRVEDQQWKWWPLLPLYPYNLKRSLLNEIIPEQLWSVEQLQGLYYVAVPVRLTILRVDGGLMLFNPLPPTKELLKLLRTLERKYGSVKTIVLPTSSGLEHKISLPAMARAFPNADLWISPGQWSFPIPLPKDLLGIPSRRTKVLIEEGFPHEDICSWISLGPIDIGLGRFQEICCFHKPSACFLVTDSLVGIKAKPPAIFNLDPIPLLFHARERGDQRIEDSPMAREKGWARVVLFASFLRPSVLDIPPLFDVIKFSFRPGLRTPKFHFGLFPFKWNEGWYDSAKFLLGNRTPLLQVAPVIERLVLPRSKDIFLDWLEEVSKNKGMKWLVSAHYESKVEFRPNDVRNLIRSINKRKWASNQENFRFLDNLDKTLLKLGIVPKNPGRLMD